MLKYMLDTDIAIYIGFPIALVLAWIFDVTPQGVVRTDAGTTTGLSRGRKLDAVIIVVPSTTSTAEHPRACAPQSPTSRNPLPRVRQRPH